MTESLRGHISSWLRLCHRPHRPFLRHFTPIHRLLIVDDHPKIVQLLDRVFSAHHFRVTTATTARDALQLAEAGTFDLALLDWHLPDLDGIELARKLAARAAARHEPLAIWLLTGSDPDSVTGRAVAASCIGVVQKPLPLDQLVYLLEAYQAAHA